jgi:hypothetical protein
MDPCLHEKRKANAVEAIPLSQPATWLAQPAATWGVIASAKSVELPHGPLNNPLWWKLEHTHHTLEIPLAKLSFSVLYLGVALSGEWRGSEGQRASRPVGSPPRSSGAEAPSKSFEVRQDFSALVCSSVKALLKSYGF